ncbi:MAG: creatininase family protein [bacterium]
MERQLQRLHWLRVRELVPDEIDTILLPVGTVEGHGAACLGTDNVIPEALAADLAEHLNALVAPVVPYGITKSLYRYPGGSSINPETFSAYILDILRSLADSRFVNILIINGHGGNNSALKETAYRFHRECKARVAVLHWWELCAEMTIKHFGHAGGHAGTDETAMVQAIDESLVDPAAHDDDLAWFYRPGADVFPIPGSILLYKENEGVPNFDLEQAQAYYTKVVQTVGDFAQLVLDRWRKYEL